MDVLKVREVIALGASVLGAAVIFAAPAAATPAPPSGTITPGDCVMNGGYVEYDVTANGESNGRGTCYEGKFDRQRLFDPSQDLDAPVINNKGKPSSPLNGPPPKGNGP